MLKNQNTYRKNQIISYKYYNAITTIIEEDEKKGDFNRIDKEEIYQTLIHQLKQDWLSLHDYNLLKP